MYLVVIYECPSQLFDVRRDGFKSIKLNKLKEETIQI